MKTPKEIVNIAKAKQEHDNTWNYSWLPGKDFVSSVLAGGLRLYFSFYGDELIPRDREGIIPSYATWNELVEEVNKFYEQNDTEAIDNFNWTFLALFDVRKSWHPVIQQDKSGCIYLIQSNGLCKIGITKDFERRMADFQRTIPTEVNIVWSAEVEDAYKMERALHEHFKDKWVKGEWFDLNEDDMQYIKGFF